MAKLWMVAPNSEVTTSKPWGEIPLKVCQVTLGLRSAHYKSDPARRPRLVDSPSPLDAFRHPVAVIVEVEEAEAVAEGWKAGFYFSELSPQEVAKRLDASASAAAADQPTTPSGHRSGHAG